MAPLISGSWLKLGCNLENIPKAVAFLHWFIFWSWLFCHLDNIGRSRKLTFLSLLQYFQSLVLYIFNLSLIFNLLFWIILKRNFDVFLLIQIRWVHGNSQWSWRLMNMPLLPSDVQLFLFRSCFHRPYLVRVLSHRAIINKLVASLGNTCSIRERSRSFLLNLSAFLLFSLGLAFFNLNQLLLRLGRACPQISQGSIWCLS